jgi:hypothetical protein
MSLRTKLGLSREASLEEGTPDEVAEKKRRAYEEAVRPARLEVARRNSKWTEIENDLVPRNRGWLVSASTDAICQPVRGVVFQPWTVTVTADQAALFYFVDDDGELHFLERIPGTWTEHLEKQAARERAKAAPKPRRPWVESQ